MNKKRLLIICDSHGTNWGCIGYASKLNKRLEAQWDVTVLAYPGMSLKKIYRSLLEEQLGEYEAIVLGVGNPDVHPRIPRAITQTLKKIGIRSVRDSYFSVPPRINLSYIARLPFFIFRLIAIRLKTETYTSSIELKSLASETLKFLSNRTENLYILPLFKVNPYIYGKHHNINTDIINNHLRSKHKKNLIEDPRISENVYSSFRNYDFFHFRDGFQIKICEAIESKIST